VQLRLALRDKLFLVVVVDPEQVPTRPIMMDLMVRTSGGAADIVEISAHGLFVDPNNGFSLLGRHAKGKPARSTFCGELFFEFPLGLHASFHPANGIDLLELSGK